MTRREFVAASALGVVMPRLTAGGVSSTQASAFAALAMKGIRQEYPNKPEHTLAGPEDAKTPRALHPAFYGCYDWHSSVHGHWMLIRLLRRQPEMAEAKAIRAALNANLTEENLRGEVAYFERKESKPFERPYGWAWLLKLYEELRDWPDADSINWSKTVQPLALLIVKRYLDYFPKQNYPIRSGVHSNTAFGLAFARDSAAAGNHTELLKLITERATTYFGKDTDAPAKWEPSGADFFSPTLMEADLMRRVLPPAEFRRWLEAFLPGLLKEEPKSLFTPATVTDRTDPQLVHLDGLNLSRAWCLKGVASALPMDDPRRVVLEKSAVVHAEAGLAHVASGDYAGEHWLASFAVYMLG